MGSRFDNKGVCLCDRITDGTCKQCSACDCCTFFKKKYSNNSNSFFGVPVGNGYYIGSNYFRFR